MEQPRAKIEARMPKTIGHLPGLPQQFEELSPRKKPAAQGPAARPLLQGTACNIPVGRRVIVMPVEEGLRPR